MYMPCADIGNIDHDLRTRNRKAPVLRGIVSGGFSLMEFYRNEDGTEWAVVLTGTNGGQCLIFHGDELEELPWILDTETEDEPA